VYTAYVESRDVDGDQPPTISYLIPPDGAGVPSELVLAKVGE
jgi:hypothetical protein